MRIDVLMSSGEKDSWEEVADALNQEGALIVIAPWPENPTPGTPEVKTLTSQKLVEQGPDLPPMEINETWRIMAVYAPGMWMRAEFV